MFGSCEDVGILGSEVVDYMVVDLEGEVVKGRIIIRYYFLGKICYDFK